VFVAINITQLVRDQLDPVLTLDPTITDAIPRQIDAQIALQGWATSDLTEQKSVYISVLATKGLIPRLLLKFSQKVAKAKGGPAEAEFVEAIKFLEALQKELAAQAKAAAWEADPDDTVQEVPKGPRSTLAGIRSI
jgi:hypothetical protein